MGVCQHCGLTGIPLVRLAGAVHVCHSCWHAQHDAHRTTCSRCRTSIQGWRAPKELNSRVVCEKCWDESRPESPFPPSFYPSQAGQIIWNGDPLKMEIVTSPNTISANLRFDPLLYGEKPVEPVTEEEMDYVRKSLGVEQ